MGSSCCLLAGLFFSLFQICLLTWFSLWPVNSKTYCCHSGSAAVLHPVRSTALGAEHRLIEEGPEAHNEIILLKNNWTNLIWVGHTKITFKNVKKLLQERKEIQSQNHRIYEIGRDLWRSSNPRTCYEYSQLKQVAQGHVLLCFEYLQWETHHKLSGKPVPVFNPPWKSFACIFKRNFLYLSLFTFLLVLSLCMTEKSLALSSKFSPMHK